MKKVISALFIFSSLSLQAQVFESSFISPVGQFAEVHSSTLTEILGQVTSCWYAGTREGAKDVQIYCADSSRATSSWSAPRVAVAANVRHDGDMLKSKSLGNPVLFFDSADQKTYLFFGAVAIGGWAMVRPFYQISNDFGKTWSKSIAIEAEFSDDSADTLGRLGKFVRIKPIAISASELMLPMYYELDSKRSFSCVFEKNQQGLLLEQACQVMPGEGSLQPSLLVKDREVFAYTRSKTGFVQTSRMNLADRKWSPLQNTNLPNTDSSVDSILSSQGEILLVANAPGGRSTLSLMVSTDGLNFKKIFDFENSKNGSDEFSYPALIKSAQGIYHLSYTYLRKGIKHLRFDEAWVQRQIHEASKPRH